MKIYRYKNKMPPCDICGHKVTLENITNSREYPMWLIVCEKCGNGTQFGGGDSMEHQKDAYIRFYSKASEEKV